jgi:hypothetical protein
MIIAAFLFGCLAPFVYPPNILVVTGTKMSTIAHSDGSKILVRQDFYSLSGDAQFLVLQHECEHREGANEQQAMFYSAYRFCQSKRGTDAFLKALVRLRPVLLQLNHAELETEEKRGFVAAGCSLSNELYTSSALAPGYSLDSPGHHPRLSSAKPHSPSRWQRIDRLPRVFLPRADLP